MAKSRPDPATAARAKRIEKRLRDHHRAGQEANAAAKAGRSLERIAAKYGFTAYTLRKSRAFARAYTKRELNALCKCRRSNGLPLQWGHVTYLLIFGEKDKAKRKRLQQKAAEQGWTAPMLNAAIPRRKRSRRHGRTIASPATVEVGLQQLVLEGTHWTNRCRSVLELVKAESTKGFKSAKARQLAPKASDVLRDAVKEAFAACQEITQRHK